MVDAETGSYRFGVRGNSRVGWWRPDRSHVTDLDFRSLLFSAHMTQHLLLVQIAAPLVWLGTPLVPTLWGLPQPARRFVGSLFARRNLAARVGHIVSVPLVAATVHLAVGAAWHVPAFYDAAQGRSRVHDLEQALFLGTALLYWWPVIHPSGGSRRLGFGFALVYLLPLLLLETVLGALLTFASRPLYTTYALAPRVTSLSAVEDQQLAGLIMWVPGGMMLLTPFFALLAVFLREDERAAVARERRADRRGAL